MPKSSSVKIRRNHGHTARGAAHRIRHDAHSCIQSRVSDRPRDGHMIMLKAYKATPISSPFAFTLFQLINLNFR